ncbi:MAG TPA: carboxypeptidase-like regulatory domain-containing protein [Gemmataceae bacterium]|nr:carboxypeptidase-like regulatory domain-containing protein [Gemmataceae bacterium]
MSLAMLTLGGCGDKRYPIKGRVHFPDGSPLKVGRVCVVIEPGKTGAWGYIGEDGTFTLGSNTPDDGLPAGTYRVYIMDPEDSRMMGKPRKANEVIPPLIHPRFTSPETSGLTFEVPKQTEWDIVVQKP